VTNQRSHNAPIELGPPVFDLGSSIWLLQDAGQQDEGQPGETTNATSSEKSIAADAPTGMGRIYVPSGADKGHRQYGRNHAKVAKMWDCPPRQPLPRDSLIARHDSPQPEVAHHVFDDNNGVIYKNADREDQSKERDAVDGVAQEVKH